MSTIHDLSAFRQRRAQEAAPPTRDPDFSIHAWLEGGEVEWTWYQFGEHELLESHGNRVAALLDAAWMFSTSRHAAPDEEKPALWWTVDNAGHNTLIYPQSLYTDANWRHAMWLARRWWNLTRRLARIAWWMTRGRR